MGGITPARTKQKVIRYWLSGLTRDEIVNKVGISEGNVSSIIQQTKDNIPLRSVTRTCCRTKKEWIYS